MSSVFRRLSLPFLLLFALTACETVDPTTQELVSMGDFRLSHNVVYSEKALQGPLSRKAAPGSWDAVMKDEINRRFGRYEGDKLYHLGISVDAYVLAAPGVPVVFSPKSILIIKVTAWDDAANRKLNPVAKQITVLESVTGETILGSGLTQNKTQQQRNLARNAAKAVQKWLLEHPEWFGMSAAEGKAAREAVGTTAVVDAEKLAADQKAAAAKPAAK